MDAAFLKTQWDAFWSAPVPAVLFLAIGAIAAWWLRNHVDKGQINALKERLGVSEERARLAADRVPPTADKPVETDDKGNVKPPEQPNAPETPTDDQRSETNEFSLFIDMQYAYLEEGDCLSKVSEYYENLKSVTGGLIDPRQIEAEYLLARFRCGASSALDTLKAQGGPTPEAFFANAVLGTYYQSIGEKEAALQYLECKFEHAPDNTRKFNSAISLGQFLAEMGQEEDSVSFLKDQMSYFRGVNERAELWHAIGKIYESRGLNWKKLLCFEQSLKLNPDNTNLRFSLAYSYGYMSYGKAMARHHYEILLNQTPRNSTVANNLSVIYDEVGATTTKISLLRGAQRRKDSTYVSANLATAYAKAGFLSDARDCLDHVAASDQQETIVQAAYRTIRDQTESDRQITEKLDKLVNVQRNLFQTKALAELHKTDDDLLDLFVGGWRLEESTVIRITPELGKLTATISTENSYYEHAHYKVTAVYEPGLFQLDAQLDEASLKQRATPNPIGDAVRNALVALGSRPPERFKLILLPGESDVLYGLRVYLATRKSEGTLLAGAQSDEELQAMLNAAEVKLTKTHLRLTVK